MKRLIVGVAFAAVFSALSFAAPTLTLLPSGGQVGGIPGSTAGWGFVLTNPDSNWVVLTGSSFTGSTVFGNYVDYLSMTGAPLYVAGPFPETATVTQSWNPSTTPPLGLGEFDINSTAPPGTSIPGNIIVHYSVFSQDPNDPAFNPDNSTVVADATLSVAADVNVVPEPATLSLLAGGALVIMFRRRT